MTVVLFQQDKCLSFDINLSVCFSDCCQGAGCGGSRFCDSGIVQLGASVHNSWVPFCHVGLQCVEIPSERQTSIKHSSRKSAYSTQIAFVTGDIKCHLELNYVCVYKFHLQMYHHKCHVTMSPSSANRNLHLFG